MGERSESKCYHSTFEVGRAGTHLATGDCCYRSSHVFEVSTRVILDILPYVEEGFLCSNVVEWTGAGWTDLFPSGTSLVSGIRFLIPLDDTSPFSGVTFKRETRMLLSSLHTLPRVSPSHCGHTYTPHTSLHSFFHPYGE